MVDSEKLQQNIATIESAHTKLSHGMGLEYSEALLVWNLMAALMALSGGSGKVAERIVQLGPLTEVRPTKPRRGPKNQSPHWRHNCESCRTLGAFHDNGTDFDLYWCSGGKLGKPTVVARFGNEGGDYVSGIGFIDASSVSSLKEAKRRADAAGLIVSTLGMDSLPNP